MSTLYVETSAVLTWLLGESLACDAKSAMDAADRIVTSALTSLETKRALIRAEAGALLTASETARLHGLFEQAWNGWYVMEISQEIRDRAASRFPIEPIRSLDAIHLAAVLQFVRAFQDLHVLSYDRRIVQNLEPLGLVQI